MARTAKAPRRPSVRLSKAQKEAVLAQVKGINLSEFAGLIEEHIPYRKGGSEVGDLEPASVIPLAASDEAKAERQKAIEIAEEALRAGKVAALVVAGGTGTRLKYPHPKGMFETSPIEHKSLFQLHAEKIRAASRRYCKPIPWYVMTSTETDAETRACFEKQNYFGICPNAVCIFQQKSMPVVDAESGNVLMAGKGQVAMSPNGHGGTIEALDESGALADMAKRGIRTISYFQVDNPLIKIIDPVFLGYHLVHKSDFSSKALPKRNAEEGLGVFCTDGKTLQVVEYSDLPPRYKYAQDQHGNLIFSAGSIAIHAIQVSFVKRLCKRKTRLPWHAAHKAVKFMDARGRRIKPSEPNAVKFEKFIFDVLPHARRPLVVMVERWDEFAPIKRKCGEDSPETARQAQVNLFGRWLEEAGVSVPRDARGNVFGAIEISPFYARDAEELRRRLPKDTCLTVELNLQQP